MPCKPGIQNEEITNDNHQHTVANEKSTTEDHFVYGAGQHKDTTPV